jgi:GNAT superfamily N-acetyltransferase
MAAPEEARISIVDVTDDSTYRLLPPCADPGFDHRSCDYWEDADRGTKAIRLAWIEPASAAAAPEPRRRDDRAGNPFLSDLAERAANPFAPGLGSGRDGPASNPFAIGGDDAGDNPFAPRRASRPAVPETAPPKLKLLARGLGVVGSYAKVLLLDEVPAAYAQFGPLTAYPRAQRTRDLYPALPAAPLPAVITCIATTAATRGMGLGSRLVAAICEDLAGRGFAAVETYPAIGADPDATSAADPAFWAAAGFVVAAPDERFPVMRLELA